MDPHDLFEIWKRRRGRIDGSAELVERVMDAARRESARHLLVAGWMSNVLRWRVIHIGIGAVACAACLFRMLLLVGLFLGPAVQ
jgi:hypothetical protein